MANANDIRNQLTEAVAQANLSTRDLIDLVSPLLAKLPHPALVDLRHDIDDVVAEAYLGRTARPCELSFSGVA